MLAKSSSYMKKKYLEDFSSQKASWKRGCRDDLELNIQKTPLKFSYCDHYWTIKHKMIDEKFLNVTILA